MFVNTDSVKVTEMAKALFKEERSIDRLDGWFLSRETALKIHEENKDKPKEISAALELKAMVENLPLSVSDYNIFCGTQRDAFAKSYALINPSFKVENFCGYCDPTAVFDGVAPKEEFSRERMNARRGKTKQSDDGEDVFSVYDK
jgi:formate C-acetyltransferase